MVRSAGAGSAVSRRLSLSHEEWQAVNEQLGLSERELQLVQQIFDGKKLYKVALDMKLSLATVKTYTQRVHRKLGLSDQRQLVLCVAGVWEQLRQPED